VYKNIDLVVIGAGLSGCVIAERAAKLLNWKVLIIERRDHIAGNCFDKNMENGLLVHQYGPHYFRTNNSQLVDYLSQFTSWIEGNYLNYSLQQWDKHPKKMNASVCGRIPIRFNRDNRYVSPISDNAKRWLYSHDTEYD
jgi:UDP-galactopyranose mutase